MFFVNLVKKENVFGLKFMCNEVFWRANEFEDDFGVDDFLDKINVVDSESPTYSWIERVPSSRWPVKA